MSESSTNDPVVSASDLTKRFGTHTAVDRVSFDVRRGECWGLLGPNGAGKTTLLRMLTARTHPSEGRLRVLGHETPRDSRLARARIGVVAQKDNLDPDFTVEENLDVFATYFGLSKPARRERIGELLAFASLEARRHARISELSGGMQRRLSLGRALVNRPELLILDEPTTGLDPQARLLIWQRLRELRSAGMTLVLTTHHMDEAQRLCDRVTVMDHGKLLASAPPDALIEANVEAEVVEVYGAGVAPWHERIGRDLGVRFEVAGENHYYYTSDAGRVLERLAGSPDVAYVHRRANLEDVFLKLTGRDLRDD